MNPNKNSRYVVFSLVFLGLSIIGGYYLLKPKKTTTSFETVKTEVESVSPTKTEIASDSSKPVNLSPTPTPIIKSFKTEDVSLTFDYPSYRRLYEEDEASGKRYALYDSSGMITIHVGKEWSWNNPGRDLESGKSVFEVDNKQKLIDFEKGGLKITVQCVYNNNQKVLAECEEVEKSIKVNTQ